MLTQEAIDHFMQLAGQEVRERPGWPSESVIRLRVDLINEEVNELIKAVEVYDLVAVADALADLYYVTVGMASAFGIRLAPVLEAVHQANLQKFGPGGRRDERGKWLKPPDWQPPPIKALLDSQAEPCYSEPAPGNQVA